MHNKFSREELRIIEQTKKEGEELYSSKKHGNKRKKVMVYVWLIFIFLLITLITKLVFGWFAR